MTEMVEIPKSHLEEYRKCSGVAQELVLDIKSGKLKNPTLICRETGEVTTYLDSTLNFLGWKLQPIEKPKPEMPLFEQEEQSP
ncbi:MAG: hypothetical protein OSB62_08965 [Alphaproteobacteria bacterium]|nr:hypothetical protein [Alphaproteobacteria bacterium]